MIATTAIVQRSGYQSLPALIGRFEEQEAKELDKLVELPTLRMNNNLNIEVPGMGEFALNDWSKRQIGTLLGIKFDWWFVGANPEEQAQQMNQRFARTSGQMMVRTTKVIEPGVQADGTLRALVSAGYSPIKDSFVARTLLTSLEGKESEFPLIRFDSTSRSTSYVVGIGKPYQVGQQGTVGQVHGGILIVNSGVGFASLRLTLHLTRLVCLNGMVVPIGDAELLRRKHRGLLEEQLWEVLTKRMASIPRQLTQGANVLNIARERRIENIQDEVANVLRRANLPRRLIEPIMTAFNREPHGSAFGIAQALSDHRMMVENAISPEERLQLEDAAGTYLRTATNTQ